MKSSFAPNGFAYAVWLDRPLVDAAGKIVEERSGLTEMEAQFWL